MCNNKVLVSRLENEGPPLLPQRPSFAPAKGSSGDSRGSRGISMWVQTVNQGFARWENMISLARNKLANGEMCNFKNSALRGTFESFAPLRRPAKGEKRWKKHWEAKSYLIICFHVLHQLLKRIKGAATWIGAASAHAPRPQRRTWRHHHRPRLASTGQCAQWPTLASAGQCAQWPALASVRSGQQWPACAVTSTGQCAQWPALASTRQCAVASTGQCAQWPALASAQ